MDKRKILRFRNFPIYKKLRAFRLDLVKYFNRYPYDEKRRLVDQGLRAINSCCLNIAEGANKPTDKEFAQFVNRSLTSLEEVASVIDLSLDNKFLDKNGYKKLNSSIEALSGELLRFERSLRKTQK